MKNNYLINTPVSMGEFDMNHVNDDLPRFGKNFNYNQLKSNYCVYVHINKINCKKYIGISSNLYQRWSSQGLSYKNCNKFANAIKKYGWDNFEHIVLMNGLTSEMASEIEKQLISKFDTKNNGYNTIAGGLSEKHVKDSTARKPVHQYDLDGIYIQTFDSRAEAIKVVTDNIRTTLNFNSHDNNFAYGFLWSDTLVDQMPPYRPIRAEYLDEYHKPSRKSDRIILQIDFFGNIVSKYHSIYEVYSDCNQRYFLQNCLDSKTNGNRYDGYIWVYEDEYDSEKIKEYIKTQKTHKSAKVCMYDLDGNYLNTFKNTVDASKHTVIPSGSIAQCCNKYRRYTGQYQWIYEGDTPPSKYVYNKKQLPVCKIDINTNEVLDVYPSLNQASKSLNMGDKSKTIKRAAQGLIESAYGYIWKFVDESA